MRERSSNLQMVAWDPTPFVTRHLARPLLFLTTEFALYAFCVVEAVIARQFAGKLLFSFAAGVLTATLAIIGHDSAHRGGTPYRWLNRIIGTIGFLPALHPLSRWEYHHNQIHHRYTAQIGLDNAYSPMTVEQFRAATPARQQYYRFLRTLAGQFLFYPAEVWLFKIFWPRPAERGSFERRDYADLAIVYAWTLLLPAALTFVAYRHAPSAGFWLALANALVFGLLIPFIVWNLFISFVTVVQHTGPTVKWSLPTGRPSTPEQKLRGTVRIRFPEAIDLLFHRLMQHPAHHLNAMIPLYSIKSAQRGLEVASASDVLSIRWSPAYHWRLMKTCKLYDPHTDSWRGFDAAKIG